MVVLLRTITVSRLPLQLYRYRFLIKVVSNYSLLHEQFYIGTFTPAMNDDVFNFAMQVADLKIVKEPTSGKKASLFDIIVVSVG